ncbi:MAG: hypothetical protein J5682_09035, partial [Prevotella sp.]|nr:hypothetical protein [Prevotella sp.]
MKNTTVNFSICVCVMAMMVACGKVSVPETYQQVNQPPHIYPDYIGVTVPVNIAPLSFLLDEECEEMVARYSYGDTEILTGGKDARPDAEEWRQLMGKAQGHDIQVEVFANSQQQWKRYKPFHITVSPDSIDPYISYRLISPSYVAYEELTINQRCLENDDESVIYDNMLCSTASDGQCVNCH